MVDVHQVTMDVTGLLSCYFCAAVDAEAEVDLVSQAVPVVVTVAVDAVPLSGFCSFFAAVATVSKMECCSIFCMRRRYIGNSFHYEKGCVTAPFFVIKKSFLSLFSLCSSYNPCQFHKSYQPLLSILPVYPESDGKNRLFPWNVYPADCHHSGNIACSFPPLSKSVWNTVLYAASFVLYIDEV